MSDYDYWRERCVRNKDGELIYKGPGKSRWIDFLLKGRELNEIFLSRVDCNGSYQYNPIEEKEETSIKKTKSISFVYSSDDDSLVEPPKERKKYRRRNGKRMRKKTPGLSKKITRNRTKERCHKYERTIGDYNAEHNEMWIYEEDSYYLKEQMREEHEYMMNIMSMYDNISFRICGCDGMEICHECYYL